MTQQLGDAGDPDPDLMTVTQTAKFLRVRPTDIMIGVREGEIPFHRVRRRLLFSRAEILLSMQTARRHDGNAVEER